jgi:hypothetical protein
LLGLADARHESGQVALADVLLDLDADHFSRAHPLIQELDHATQLGRDEIRDKNQPDTTRAQVLLNLVPEPLQLKFVAEAVPEDLLGVLPSFAQRVSKSVRSRSAGEVSFSNAKFSAGEVGFDRARFSGARSTSSTRSSPAVVVTSADHWIGHIPQNSSSKGRHR